MIAAVATGAYADMTACAEAWVTPHLGDAQAPDACLAKRYDRMFPAYVEASALASRPIWKRLAALRAGGDDVRPTIAIIGDRFMLPRCFADRHAAACGKRVRIKTSSSRGPINPWNTATPIRRSTG